MKMLGLKLVALALVAAVAVACVTSAVTAQGKPPIKIGLITPKTGNFAQMGIDMADGFKLYMAEIDYTVAGRKIQLIEEDEGAQPAQHMEAAHLVDPRALGGEGPVQPLVLLLGEQPGDLLADRHEGGLAVDLDQGDPELLGGRAQLPGGPVEVDRDAEADPGDVAFGQAAHVGAQVGQAVHPPHPGGEHQLSPGEVGGGVGELADRDPLDLPVRPVLAGEQPQPQTRRTQQGPQCRWHPVPP